MANEIYKIRVLPFVKKVVVDDFYVKYIDNLTKEEIDSMSCEPRKMWDFGDGIYFAQLPHTDNSTYGNINHHLFYIYDELNDEEKEKYFDKTVVVDTIRPKVTMVYPKVTTIRTRKRTKK